MPKIEITDNEEFATCVLGALVNRQSQQRLAGYSIGADLEYRGEDASQGHHYTARLTLAYNGEEVRLGNTPVELEIFVQGDERLSREEQNTLKQGCLTEVLNSINQRGSKVRAGLRNNTLVFMTERPEKPSKITDEQAASWFARMRAAIKPAAA